jgi:hypothetical protein
MWCDKTNNPGREDFLDPPVVVGPAGRRHVQGRANRHRSQQWVRHPGTRVSRTPFTATRTGDVAPSVVVADPALFVTPTAPPAEGPH